MADKTEKRKVEPGKVLEELLKGSYEYTIYIIVKAFFTQFRRTDRDWFWVVEVFADHLIVGHEELPTDEFYFVPYSNEGGTYVFAIRDDWEVVELAYKPKATMVQESKKNKQRNRIEECTNSSLTFAEAATSQNPDGPWAIRAVGLTADIVNGNNRRYARHVLEAAVREAQTHLNESLGQGRLILTGEVDHPNDKGNYRATLTDTVINWTSITFDGKQVRIEGQLLGTSKGRDIRAVMLGGIKPDVSQRAYGRSVFVEEDGVEVEEVTELHLTGYDLVLEGADPNGRIVVMESKQPNQNSRPEEDSKMDKLTLEQLREQYPDHVAKIEAETNQKRREMLEAELKSRADQDERVAKQIAEREARLREQFGIGPEDDLDKALAERTARLAELEETDKTSKEELAKLREAEQKRKVEAYIVEAVSTLEYDEDVAKMLTDALVSAAPADKESVDKLIEAKRVEYDAWLAKIKLAAKGKGTGDVEVTGTVFESETGKPDYLRPAHEFTERMVERTLAQVRDFKESPQLTPNERFTRRYLEAFDKAYRSQLIEEHKQLRAFLEAEQTSDLNLPYSVSRAIIEQAFPELVALSIFDFALEDGSPTYIYFESYADESGAAPTVTDESFTSDAGAWVDLDYKRIQVGTVTVTSNPAGTTYAEFDDYVIDYGNGQIMVLSTGSMADATGYLIDYTYDAVRLGEAQGIQRGKGQLSRSSVELAADRLAAIVTDEAITFSRTQLGWDAVARTLAMVVRELRQMLDSHMISKGLASAVIAGNAGSTWTYGTTEAALDLLVWKLGEAKVAVMNDYYMPTFFLASLSNAEILSNWKGFTRDGFPDAVLRSTGFVGAVKGLPLFQSPQMVDSHFLTGHPELVQHRVLSTKPMTINGPFQGMSSNNLIAAKEYYAEEYNATVSLITNKGGYVTVETA